CVYPNKLRASLHSGLVDLTNVSVGVDGTGTLCAVRDGEDGSVLRKPICKLSISPTVEIAPKLLCRLTVQVCNSFGLELLRRHTGSDLPGKTLWLRCTNILHDPLCFWRQGLEQRIIKPGRGLCRLHNFLLKLFWVKIVPIGNVDDFTTHAPVFSGCLSCKKPCFGLSLAQALSDHTHRSNAFGRHPLSDLLSQRRLDNGFSHSLGDTEHSGLRLTGDFTSTTWERGRASSC